MNQYGYTFSNKDGDNMCPPSGISSGVFDSNEDFYNPMDSIEFSVKCGKFKCPLTQDLKKNVVSVSYGSEYKNMKFWATREILLKALSVLDAVEGVSSSTRVEVRSSGQALVESPVVHQQQPISVQSPVLRENIAMVNKFDAELGQLVANPTDSKGRVVSGISDSILKEFAQKWGNMFHDPVKAMYPVFKRYVPGVEVDRISLWLNSGVNV